MRNLDWKMRDWELGTGALGNQIGALEVGYLELRPNGWGMEEFGIGN